MSDANVGADRITDAVGDFMSSTITLRDAALVHVGVGLMLCSAATASLLIWTSPYKESRPFLAAGLMYWFWACFAMFVAWIAVLVFDLSNAVKGFAYGASNFSSFAVVLLALTLLPWLGIKVEDERVRHIALRAVTVIGLLIALAASLYLRVRLGVNDVALYRSVAVDGSLIAMFSLSAALLALKGVRDATNCLTVVLLLSYGAHQLWLHQFDRADQTKWIQFLYLAAVMKFITGLAVTYAIARPPRDWNKNHWRQLNNQWQIVCLSIGILGASWFPVFVAQFGVLDGLVGPESRPLAVFFFIGVACLFSWKPAVDLYFAVQRSREIVLKSLGDQT